MVVKKVGEKVGEKIEERRNRRWVLDLNHLMK
jgi:hypothetical protein